METRLDAGSYLSRETAKSVEQLLRSNVKIKASHVESLYMCSFYVKRNVSRGIDFELLDILRRCVNVITKNDVFETEDEQGYGVYKANALNDKLDLICEGISMKDRGGEEQRSSFTA